MVAYLSWNIIYYGFCVLLMFRISETFQARTIDDNSYTNHFRRKRQVNCEEKYRVITSRHTACLPPSSKFIARNAGVTEKEKKVIVDIHNTVRREVSPPARNMMLMSWDEEIANTAQRWAENCNINHDSNYKRYAFGRFSVGQNLAWGSWSMGWTDSIKLWADEKKDYSYSMNGSPTRKAVGHYTQMVWATSIKVGCGYAICGSTHYYVCNYGPGGNSNGVRPYLSGTTCQDCPNTCRNGLCDCGSTVCLNGGKMNPNTCTCTCTEKLDFYIPPYCGLNCTDTKDPFYCLQQWGTQSCERFSNVPQQCPNMCKWCPTAAYKPKDVSAATRSEGSSVGLTLIVIILFLI
ncbi:cysteine-rich venom protein ENH2-like isoform X2 [Mercenaria mercenaria]|uniref:cysteine-rich venom protein ENH2-like isoform X2 n=1 Tax=Mercenaria mercenaria TaxID=6596 RepID=UPI00234EF573|nr:cysteine-rich venom protein ENH2-like isoform X2 [Mercenaria mercenaria]